MNEQALSRLRTGVPLDGSLTAPAEVVITAREGEFSWLRIVLHEHPLQALAPRGLLGDQVAEVLVGGPLAGLRPAFADRLGDLIDERYEEGRNGFQGGQDGLRVIHGRGV